MAIKVGTIQVDLIANTASFTGPLDKAPAHARRSAGEIQDAFNGMDLSEARGTLMVTGELIGVHIPRHVQALIATLPGLAPILSAAFPVIAILAVGDAIFKATERAEKHREELEKARQATEDAAFAFARHTDALEINNLKLKDRLAILNQQPAQNGVAIAAYEAKKKIDELEDSLKKALLTQQSLFKAQIDSSFMSFIGKGSGQVSEMASHFHQGLEQIKEYYDDWHRYENMGDTANAEKFKGLYEQKKQGIHDFAADAIKSLKAIESAPAPVLKKSELSPDPDRAKAQQSAATDTYERQRAAAAELLPAVQTLYGTFLQGEKQLAEETKAAELEKGIARAESMQQHIALLDKQYASEKQVTAEQTKQALATYQVEFDQGKITAEKLAELKQAALDKEYEAELAHLEKVKGLEAGRPALQKRTDEQIAALDAGHQAQVLTTYAATLAKEKELNKSLYDSFLADYAKDEAALEKDISAKNKAYMDFVKVQHEAAKQHAEALEAIEAQGLQFKRAMGLISEADYEARMQTELNVTYMTARKELQARRDATLAGTAARAAADAQLQALEDKYQKDSERNEQQSLLRRAANFRQLSSTITSSLDGWIRGTEKFSAAWNKLWTGMMVKAIESLIQVGIQELIGLAIHQTIADKKKLTDAKSAFHGAYAATSDIPIIGPVLAPIAGAAAFAAVMAFEKGGIVPQDAYALVHHNEMVLPAPIANFIVNAASQGSGSGGTTHYHFINAPTVHATDAEGLDRVLTKNSEVVKKHFMDHARRIHAY